MALIVITIKDQDDGSVAVQMTDEPQVTHDQEQFSPAQNIAAAALNAIHNELQEPRIIDPSKKKLQLVGADEMPL